MTIDTFCPRREHEITKWIKRSGIPEQDKNKNKQKTKNRIYTSMEKRTPTLNGWFVRVNICLPAKSPYLTSYRIFSNNFIYKLETDG